jgi:copper chaperone CopZ
MNTEVLKVKGMTCGGCSAAIARALKATPGVQDVAVDLAGAAVTVRYDESAANVASLRKAIEGAGYQVVEKSTAPKRAGGCCCG